jgi:outer membrane biosynthesis protein TonB
MSEKVDIRREQVVSEKGGYVSYVDSNSTLRKAPQGSVNIIDEHAAAPSSDEPSQPLAASGVEVTGQSGVAVEALEHTPEPSPPPEQDANPQPTKERKVATTKSKTKTKAAPKKAPAKRAVPRVASEPRGVRTIGGKTVDLSKYQKAKTAAGGSSFNNGDSVAEKLEGKTLEDVYGIVAKALKVEEKELRSKYKHLNPGMQRMTLGNRLRKVMIPKAQRP